MHWRLAVAAIASGAEDVREERLDGIHAIWTGTMFPLSNQLIVDRPVAPEQIAEQALRFVSGREVPWMLCVPRDWLDEHGAGVLNRCGLVPAMQLTYMSANRLRPPQKPAPDAEYRLVDSEEMAAIVSDLNADAYGMPREWGRSALSNPRMWTEDGVGVVAYEDGIPVSTASVVPTSGCLNVVCVATAADHRGRGHAEAAMRQVLDLASRKLNLTRTVLHASDMGKPIYARMGYQSGAVFSVWTPGHPEA